MKKVGRNEPCPCGSGKKYNRCHANEPERASIVGFVILGIIVVGTTTSVVLAVRDGDLSTATGRTWSAEHGHWHDSNGQQAGGNTNTPAPDGTGTPPPGAEAWSAEHGHWHDANGQKVDVAANTPASPPLGPAPPGKVWSAEHGHWHDGPTTAPAEATQSVDPSAVPLLRTP